MDRNTLTGLVLIGLILTVFSIFNQPSDEDIKKKAKTEQLNAKEKEAVKKETAKASSGKSEANASNQVKKHLSEDVKGEIITIENDKLIIDLNTKGGLVAAVYLKNYKSYFDFANKKDKPLCLFKNGDAVNQLVLTSKKGKIYTSKYLFDVKSKSKNAITFELELADGKIAQSYYLNKGKFDLDYDIELDGFENITRNNIQFNWQTAFRKSERLFSEQRRVTTICYEQKNEGFSYLSEASSDFIESEDDLNWVAYKQSYFSSFLKPKDGFSKEGSKMMVKVYKEGDAKNSTHLKDFSSTLSLNFKNDKASFNWYFGPNDYELLKSYDSNYDDILNFGWGLFRWINLYAVQPIFNLLVSSGMGIGIAILVLTIILKFILMPVQWKMFLSSVKMRILKPEVDELNAKYPKPEDAMKKQMEMMTLYRESGASPLAGCVPMLIQMPILLAVFRFFPAAFELRQQPFLWAEDLSSYDSIWDFGVNIWPYGDHVSLFTLLMSVTTLLYTWMNSGNMQQPQQPGMPNMKVIMYIFPVMMIFFFNNYSAGLSYYYFISTLISILIMVIIKQFFADEDKLRAKMAERKAQATANPKEKKKSRFQEKLEEMQKKQLEMKNKK
ncbi:MAG: membrane protein insertase YidC [Flavobacteriales bacterium]|nr:membrane protein insertase YidC [Flavobacteriales bacterium]